MRKFLERLDEPHYGLGWRSYDYAGHHIVGHRGGVNGYRSLILFDPELKSGVVALWNSNTSQPGGLEFEVMDMLYHLPFRDWMEIDKGARRRRRRASRSTRCRAIAGGARAVAYQALRWRDGGWALAGPALYLGDALGPGCARLPGVCHGL